ncbi:MAG: cation:dicarboxylase symporter family transporter, partial [Sphingomonas sp.]
FRAIAETMLVIVQWVLRVAPIGVFALAFGLGARAGGGAVAVLAHYVVIVACACLLIVLLAYVVVLVGGGLSPLRFAKAALPAQVVALSTQSSLATLPAMIEAAPALGVERNAAGIILPLAVSIFRAASAAANIAVALYLAAVYGVSPGIGMLVMGALVAAAVSLAAVGLPAQVSFFATIGPVCLALGVPVELLPLLLAVETIPDLFRTVGNVTADMAVMRLAGAGDDRGDQRDAIDVAV